MSSPYRCLAYIACELMLPVLYCRVSWCRRPVWGVQRFLVFGKGAYGPVFSAAPSGVGHGPGKPSQRKGPTVHLRDLKHKTQKYMFTRNEPKHLTAVLSFFFHSLLLTQCPSGLYILNSILMTFLFQLSLSFPFHAMPTCHVVQCVDF